MYFTWVSCDYMYFTVFSLWLHVFYRIQFVITCILQDPVCGYMFFFQDSVCDCMYYTGFSLWLHVLYRIQFVITCILHDSVCDYMYFTWFSLWLHVFYSIRSLTKHVTNVTVWLHDCILQNFCNIHFCVFYWNLLIRVFSWWSIMTTCILQQCVGTYMHWTAISWWWLVCCMIEFVIVYLVDCYMYLTVMVTWIYIIYFRFACIWENWIVTCSCLFWFMIT